MGAQAMKKIPPVKQLVLRQEQAMEPSSVTRKDANKVVVALKRIPKVASFER
jgi:hypothetical protein